jgi:hypothetical protein
MGNYALIGDLHSQVAPLLKALDYCLLNDLTPVFLGDVFDSRCEHSDSVGVYRALKNAQILFKNTQILRSNHQDKLERYLKGNKVFVSPELQRSLDDFALGGVSSSELLGWLESMPYGFCFRDENNVEHRCAHAYFPSWVEVPSYEQFVVIHDMARKARQLAMYGPSHRENRGRVFWWEGESNRDWVRVAGHYHVVHTCDRNLVLDAGCGGVKRSWFCNEPPALVLWNTRDRQLVEIDV